MNRKRYVLLDRDGTLLVSRHYLSDPAKVQLLPGVGSALRQMTAAGFGLIVVTNQSGLERGYFDEGRLALIHGRMRELLRKEQVLLDDIYYCPHVPEDNCECRKPETGMVEQAARDHDFDPRDCLVIGDNVCDMHLGKKIGAPTFLVRTGYGATTAIGGKVNPNYVVDNIWAAAQIVRRLPAIGQRRSAALSPG